MERCVMCNQSRGIGELRSIEVGSGDAAETWSVCLKCILLIQIHEELSQVRQGIAMLLEKGGS